MKVISYPEPLVLIGSDVLGAFSSPGYSFRSIGVNPATHKGELVFSSHRGKVLEICELVMCPQASCILSSSRAPKSVSFSSPLVRPYSPPPILEEKPKPSLNERIAG